MRVLFLCRQRFGGTATHVRTLAAGLKSHGIEAIVEDASDWIPNETGGRHDRDASISLRKKAADFDLVHAFGYRSAWACSEAFGHGEAWVYTAFDLPKSTHRLLIDRLNDSQAGLCSSNAVKRDLDRALAIDLVQIAPGIAVSESGVPDRTRARRRLELPAESQIVGAMGRWEPDGGFASLIAAMEQVWLRRPDAVLALAGEGSEESSFRSLVAGLPNPSGALILGRVSDELDFAASVDLLVVPGARSGFSMSALAAMSVSTPVLLRDGGGLPEMIESEVSGYLFHSDEELGTRIADLLELSLTLDAVGEAGRLRCLERFSLEQCAENVVELYRSIVEG